MTDLNLTRRPSTRDAGSSLLLVLVTMTLLVGVVTVGLQKSLGTLTFVDSSNDWKQALTAAEAGVDDYLSRLNRDDGYWQKADCANIAVKGDPAVTRTVSECGWGSSTPLGWRGVDNAPGSEFHYDIDISETAIDGTITLRSTGRVNDRYRTVESVLRRGGFGEFLYYTVYETTDPANEAVYGLNNAYAQDRCAHYFWGGEARPRPAETVNGRVYCNDINFVGGDRINGPMHSNDAILIKDDPEFRGTTSTSYPGCLPVNGVAAPQSSCYRNGGSADPTFARGITHRNEIKLPTSIGDLRRYVTLNSPGVPNDRVGCLYTGPTRIKFLPTASGGTGKMQVWSKWSGRTGGPALNPGCGTASQLQRSGGVELDLPQNKVIMVQDVPQAQAQPSATASPPTAAANGACLTGSIGDGLPVADDFNLTLNEAGCRHGTLYVEGPMKGRLTMTADNNVVVTGDLTYQGGDTGTDALGLIAANSVKIYHPVRQNQQQHQYCADYDNRGRCTRYAYYYTYTYSNLRRNNDRDVLTNVAVHAAVLTLQHSFAVQSYQHGARLGSLKVYGSLAQRFRGPVGTTGSNGGTGYLKDYNYDSRLRYAPPPYFLDPVKSGWGQKVFGEISTPAALKRP